MTVEPEDVELDPRLQEEDDDEDMPRVAITREHMLIFGLFVVSALAFLYFVRAVCAVRYGSRNQLLKIRTEAHGAAIVPFSYVLLLRVHHRNDGVRRLGIDLGGMRALEL